MVKEIGLSFLIPSYNPPVIAFCKLLNSLLACAKNIPMEINICDGTILNVTLANYVQTIGYIDSSFYIYERNSASVSKTIDIVSRLKDTEKAYLFYETQFSWLKKSFDDFSEDFSKRCKTAFCDGFLSAKPKTRPFQKQVLLEASCCEATLERIFPSFWKSNVTNISCAKQLFISFYRQFVRVTCRSHGKT